MFEHFPKLCSRGTLIYNEKAVPQESPSNSGTPTKVIDPAHRNYQTKKISDKSQTSKIYKILGDDFTNVPFPCRSVIVTSWLTMARIYWHKSAENKVVLRAVQSSKWYSAHSSHSKASVPMDFYEGRMLLRLHKHSVVASIKSGVQQQPTTSPDTQNKCAPNTCLYLASRPP